jgi:hypothetical protein
VNVSACSFHLNHYADALKRWAVAGYTLNSFRDAARLDPQAPLVVLRHDLDFRRCVPSALKMAAIEAEIGATATYFVRLHSDEYNPMEFNTYLTLKTILAAGHEIGLHFECYELSQVSGETEADVFVKGKKLLETLLDIKIVSACEHGDYHRFNDVGFKRFFERHDQAAFGITQDPYSPTYFNEMKYLSDSNQHWREGCFCRHVGHHRRLHVATHPGYWYARHYVLG